MVTSGTDEPIGEKEKNMTKLVTWLLLTSLAVGITLADSYYGNITGDRAFVFREDAALFEKPSESSGVICSPPIGAELFRLAAVDVQYEGDGMSCTWLEAFCEIDGDTCRGYIPHSWLALTDQTLFGDTLFIFGIDTYYPDCHRFVGSARAVCRGEILWESVFYPPGGAFGGNDYRYGVASRQIDAEDYTFSNLIMLSFLYEACGYENRNVLFVWTGSYLVLGISASTVFEAGVFHYSEEFIFPEQESPSSARIMLVTTKEEFDDGIMDYFITSQDTTNYFWNGLEFFHY